MTEIKPIDVHFWPTPNGRKVTIALEEMGLAYRIVPVNIGKGDQFTPEFLAISPNNRMPAIWDPEGPDGKPISVFESGAILQYLARKTGKFGGADAREQAEVESWLMWQMANLGPVMGHHNHFRNYAPKIEPDPEKLKYGAGPLLQRDQPPLWRRRNPPARPRVSCRTYIDRRFRRLAVDRRLQVAGPGSRTFPRSQPLVRPVPPASRLRKRPQGRRRPERHAASADGKDAEEARKILFGQKARI